MPKTHQGIVEMDDLKVKLLDAHDILTKYIKIHNDVFKSSLRRIIPIPGVFLAIDYGKHYGSLSELADELKYIISGVDDRNGFARALIEYGQALLQTLVLFQDMCGNLYKKSQGEVSSYSKKQYQADLDAYNSSVERYQSLGTRLNQYIR